MSDDPPPPTCVDTGEFGSLTVSVPDEFADWMLRQAARWEAEFGGHYDFTDVARWLFDLGRAHLIGGGTPSPPPTPYADRQNWRAP